MTQLQPQLQIAGVIVDLRQVPDIEVRDSVSDTFEETVDPNPMDFLLKHLPDVIKEEDMWKQLSALGMIKVTPSDEELEQFKMDQLNSAAEFGSKDKKGKGKDKKRRNLLKQGKGSGSESSTATSSELRGTHGGRVKTCVKCGQIKPLEMFGKHPNTVDGHQSYCKTCKNALGKQRRENNPEARLKHHIATRVMKQVPDYPQSLVEDLEIYLGYSMRELVQYLEKDCKNRLNMSLLDTFRENYHLDHKYPLSKYPVQSVKDQAFRDCWSIENLWMIPAEVNLKKGAKVGTDVSW